MKLSSLRYCVIPVILLTGCRRDYDCYQIEVKPEGKGFQRQLTCWHVGAGGDKDIRPVSAGKLVALAKLYPQPEASDDAKKHVFTGRFTGNTPPDVGGGGSYTHFTTLLGSTSAYVERFRGNDDLESQLDKQLAKRREAADKLADLLAGWITAELGQDPNFPRLKKFLDKDLRRDMKNLGDYTLTHQLTADSQTPSNYEFLVRAGQYFCERGYFSPQEIPMLTRALSDDDPKPLLAHVQRFLARKMGIADDQPIPASLGFLDDLPRLKTSFDKYVPSTELFHKQLEASISQKNAKTGPKEPAPPDAGEVFAVTLALDLLGMQDNFFGGSTDSLHVKLYSGGKPYATNGNWDEKSATVTWGKGLEPDQTDQALPVVCFALWSTPDRSFQETHVGKVLLTDERLAEYVIWYRSLNSEETKEWDQFLSGLKPGPELEAALKAFRFSTDPKVDPNKPDVQVGSLADTPRRLISERLEPQTTGTE